ncbi:MAG: hypothetical protein RIS88_1215 [Pseudomonadota bacterium]|jgi:hypothetical protein
MVVLKYMTRPIVQTVFLRMLCLAALGLSGLVHAQSGQCSFIQAPNLQAQCHANSGGGSGQCSFIRDADMQAAFSAPSPP